MKRTGQAIFSSALIASMLLPMSISALGIYASASAQGPLPMVPAGVHPAPVTIGRSRISSPVAHSRWQKHHYPGSVRIRSKKISAPVRARKYAAPIAPPQELVGKMSGSTIAPGVVHKVHRGAMYINLLDVDLTRSEIFVKPVLAGETFSRLDEVRNQAQKVNAIAAVNGNYFKRDGTPLGTLVIDGEWIAGPLFDRTCMGITDDGKVLVDRVKLHGSLETSNPEVNNVWVNNINQPRRNGCRVIAYTRRWGTSFTMAYDGTIIAVDRQGRVIGKSLRSIDIPAGGYILTDSKASVLSKLNVGDLVNISWYPGPDGWSRVIHAVSGGPVLIRNGQLFVDCKSENFRKSWTSNSIHARTALGVTANRHLLLATIEGPHTLWDVAKFLKKLGAVDAMNLDGGGSTTMVIGGKTVTRNQSHFQRRVASSLVVLPRGAQIADGSTDPFRAGWSLSPTGDVSYFCLPESSKAFEPQSALIPDTTKTLEIVNLPPASGQAPGQVNAEGIALQAPFKFLENAPAKKGGKGRFGWIHKLNPLDW